MSAFINKAKINPYFKLHCSVVTSLFCEAQMLKGVGMQRTQARS